MRICVHRHHHRPAPYRGLRWGYFTAVGGIAWAFIVSPALGILVVVVIAVIAGLGAYGAVAARRETRRRAMPDDGRDTGFQAAHVPASRAYKAAHPEGPRDWEQKAS
jgi:uncharacterized membrane protein